MPKGDVQIITRVDPEFRDQAIAAARRKGYGFVQEFIREQLRELLKEDPATPA